MVDVEKTSSGQIRSLIHDAVWLSLTVGVLWGLLLLGVAMGAEAALLASVLVIVVTRRFKGHLALELCVTLFAACATFAAVSHILFYLSKHGVEVRVDLVSGILAAALMAVVGFALRSPAQLAVAVFSASAVVVYAGAAFLAHALNGVAFADSSLHEKVAYISGPLFFMSAICIAVAGWRDQKSGGADQTATCLYWIAIPLAGIGLLDLPSAQFQFANGGLFNEDQWIVFALYLVSCIFASWMLPRRAIAQAGGVAFLHLFLIPWRHYDYYLIWPLAALWLLVTEAFWPRRMQMPEVIKQ
ncbi:hypothetical protein M2360_002383 [Rhizobium sp. SG_E_25_P2]|uniref:hypothetical protein n=1 Tax=Rhizobium sp. SG_E_25_P2 TaxID=2879942 RepID=UPI002474106B|nr:hypothetical protein [Rhizobium sp. SG_E_25_P2]MDH6266986.1 hypothetical protein [Rhizobium sp. SG_E_25_P2]